MKKVALLFVLLIASCKTPCDDPGSFPSKTADFLVSHWQCKNSVKVHADVMNWMAERNWCEKAPQGEGKQGMVGGLVCSFIIDRIRSHYASKVNSELNWECNEDLIGKDLAMALSGLCSLIPF